MTNAGSLRTIVAAYVVLVALTLVSFVSEGYAKGRAVQAIEVNGRLVVVTVRLFPRNERKEGWYYYDDNGKRIPIEIKTANRDGIPILSKRDVERLGGNSQRTTSGSISRSSSSERGGQELKASNPMTRPTGLTALKRGGGFLGARSLARWPKGARWTQTSRAPNNEKAPAAPVPAAADRNSATRQFTNWISHRVLG